LIDQARVAARNGQHGGHHSVHRQQRVDPQRGLRPYTLPSSDGRRQPPRGRQDPGQPREHRGGADHGRQDAARARDADPRFGQGAQLHGRHPRRGRDQHRRGGADRAAGAQAPAEQEPAAADRDLLRQPRQGGAGALRRGVLGVLRFEAWDGVVFVCFAVRVLKSERSLEQLAGVEGKIVKGLCRFAHRQQQRSGLVGSGWAAAERDERSGPAAARLEESKPLNPSNSGPESAGRTCTLARSAAAECEVVYNQLQMPTWRPPLPLAPPPPPPLKAFSPQSHNAITTKSNQQPTTTPNRTLQPPTSPLQPHRTAPQPNPTPTPPPPGQAHQDRQEAQEEQRGG